MGKCNCFSLASPGAKFYVRETAAANGKAGHGGEVSFTQGLRKELEFGGFQTLGINVSHGGRKGMFP